MDIRLIINGNVADLNEDEAITLSRQFPITSDEDDRSTSEYSFEFSLPATKNNAVIFQSPNGQDIRKRFDILYDAQLYADGLLLLDGNFLLNEISHTAYSGSLYKPQKKSISDLLSEKQLNEISRHNISASTLEGVTEINDKALAGEDTHIIFPYILYNVALTDSFPDEVIDNQQRKYFQSLNWSNNVLNLQNIYPAFNVLSVLTDVFKSYGYTIGGDAFDDARLKDLYMTLGGTNQEDYDTARNIPYYLKVTGKYLTRTASNISSTLNKVEWGGINFGYDPLLLSENTTLSEVDNDYDMLGTASDGTHTIMVAQSGWYQVNCTIHTEYPYEPSKSSEYYSQADRVNVRGTGSDYNRTDFECSALEIQLVTGSNPVENFQPYSINFGAPAQATEYNDGTSGCPTCRFAGYGALDGNYVYVADDYQLFAYNEGVMEAKNLSAYDTSNLIAVARFGRQYEAENWEYAPSRNALRPLTMALPLTPSGILYGEAYAACESDRTKYYMKLSDCASRYEFDDRCYEYTYDLAEVVVRSDSYSNTDGYRRFTHSTSDYNAGFWQMAEDNVGKKSYTGQTISKASANLSNEGDAEIHTCVWLEAGDIVNICAMTPYDEAYSSKSDKGYGGATAVNVDFSLEMYMCSPDESWYPSADDPIKPYDSNVVFNANAMLPDWSCQDFLDTLCDTFNLKLTSRGEKSYSLDKNKEVDNVGTTRDITKICDIEGIKYERLDYPYLRVRGWAIDEEEAGYASGDDSPYNTDTNDYSLPEHRGEKRIVNILDTTGEEDAIESLFSYDWNKTVNFADSPMGDNYVIPIPVQSKQEIWDDTFSQDDALGEENGIDLTSRLFYINSQKFLNGTTGNDDIVRSLNFYETDDETGEINLRVRLIVPSTSRFTYANTLNAQGDLVTFRRLLLDFDDSSTNTDDGAFNTLTDTFLNLRTEPQYTITLDCAMDNVLYNSIGDSDLIRVGSAIFRPREISNHTIDMSKQTTIVLGNYLPPKQRTVRQYDPTVPPQYNECWCLIPTVTASVPKIPGSGGTVQISVSYSQTQTCADGTTTTYTDGGTIIYTGWGVDRNGNVTADANPNGEDTMWGVVTVSVTRCGRTGTATVEIWQEAGEIECDNLSILVNPPEYVTIPAEGGRYYPNDGVRWIGRGYCSDDRLHSFDEPEIEGFQRVGYQGCHQYVSGVTINSQSGYVNAPENTETEDRLLVTMKREVYTTSKTYESLCTEVWQEGYEGCTYGVPSVTLSCSDISGDGGCTTINVSFTQSWKCGSESGTYNQNTTEWYYRAVGSPSSGVSWTLDGLQVCYDDENDGDRRSLGTVSINITANGVDSGYVAVTIYQAEGTNCETPVVTSLYYSGIPADVGSGHSTAPTTSFYQECGGERFIWQSGDPNSGQTFLYQLLSYVSGVSINSYDGTVTMTENNTSSENREICAVNVQVTRNGLTSDFYRTTVWQAGIDYSCEYDEPEITLEYETIPSKGGEICPTFSYSQHYKCTDGDEGYITDGAAVEWSLETDHPNAVQFVGNDGCIVADSSTDVRDLCAITVKVTLNGQTSTKTVTVTQSGETAGEWGWPQFSCSYANIPKDGGESDINLTITSYKYDESGNVVDWRTYQMEEGVVTYNDYGDDLTELIFDFYAEVSGVEYNEETGHLRKSSANEGGSTLLLGNVLVTATAFSHMDEGLFPVYQNAETDVYVASIEESSQYSALIGTIVNRNLAEIRVYGDRYEDGELVEPDVVLATIGYESNKILSYGDVFYGHFNDGISCGEYHINKLGMRGYNEQGYPQYFPNGYELRVDNNYLGKLDEPPEIDVYVSDIDPITITNNGPNCELYFYHISYSQ